MTLPTGIGIFLPFPSRRYSPLSSFSHISIKSRRLSLIFHSVKAWARASSIRFTIGALLRSHLLDVTAAATICSCVVSPNIFSHSFFNPSPKGLPKVTDFAAFLSFLVILCGGFDSTILAVSVCASFSGLRIFSIISV